MYLLKKLPLLIIMRGHWLIEELVALVATKCCSVHRLALLRVWFLHS